MDKCSQVNWSWNRFMNDKDRTLLWIKTLAEKHNLSDMDVTKHLRTEGAFNHCTLQMLSLEEWKNTSIENHNETIKNLNLLHKEGLDLNFTYDTTISTSLMYLLSRVEATGCHKIAEWLIENGADISMRQGCDGRNALMIAMSSMNRFMVFKLIGHPKTQPNAKDNKGNTPLLCALESCDIWPVPSIFAEIIQQLLEKGADPELGNNDGLTPLKQAENMKNLTLINLFKDAIVKKHSTQRS